MVIIHSIASNFGGQIATGTTDDVHHLASTQLPHNISEGSPTKWRVQGGGNHAWATDGMTLLGCGLNADGELATGLSMAVLRWTAVAFPSSFVQQVACGWSHTLLLKDAGMYAVDSNAFEQLSAAPGGRW
ncbi:hypothetical protein FBU31_002029, partial [Coemansia sp. 'formosensis']